jgi:hypothetical protein
MSHLPKHLHFYMSSGYRPEATTLIVEKILRQDGEATDRVEELTLADLEGGLGPVSALSSKVNPQLDYSVEVEAILRKELGRVYVIRNGADLEGLALLHTYQRGDEASYSSVKGLLVDPHSPQPSQSFSQLMARCEAESLEQGKNRLLTRFPAGDLKLYELMLGRAFLLKGANLRMIKKGEYIERGSYSIASWAG